MRADRIGQATLDVASGTLTDGGGAAGDILVRGATNYARLAKGAAYAELRMPADGSTPAWLQRYHVTPTDLGYLGWTFDSDGIIGNSLPTQGTLYLARINVPEAISVTNVVLIVITGGGTLTSGRNFAALYQNGTLIGQTADQTTAWAGTGAMTMALTGGPFAVAAGHCHVAILANGTTSPAFARGSNTSATAIAGPSLASPNMRHATANTGLTTTLPSPHASQTASGVAYWAALT